MDKKKNYYLLNRDKILNDRANYYEQNKDKILERSSKYFKTYYEKNKEKLVKNSVTYIQELRKIMTAEQRRENLKRHKEYKIKSNKKLNKLTYQQMMDNNIVFKLPKSEIKIEQPKKKINNIVILKNSFIIDFDD